METTKVVVLEAGFDGNVLKLVTALEDMSAVHEVSMFAADWDKDAKSFKANPETEENFYDNLEKYLGLTDVDDESVQSLVDRELDVYVSSNGKATFYEPQTLSKADEEEIGELWASEIVGIIDFDSERRVVIQSEDASDPEARYFVKFNFGNYIQSKGISLPNPAKLSKQKEKFENLLGIKWEEAEQANGMKVTVEVRKNELGVGHPTYLELKKVKKRK